MKFTIEDFFSKCDQMRRKLDLVTFTEEIIDVKLHFFVQGKLKGPFKVSHDKILSHFNSFLPNVPFLSPLKTSLIF